MLHREQIERKERLAQMFGIHAALRREMDEFILKQAKSPMNKHRTPFSLEVLLGRDGTIDNFDIFNVPSMLIDIILFYICLLCVSMRIPKKKPSPHCICLVVCCIYIRS